MQPHAHTPIPPDTQTGEEHREREHGEPLTFNEEQTLYTRVPRAVGVEADEQSGREAAVRVLETDEGENVFESEQNELFDVEEDCGESEEEGETPTLYEPTSPLHLMPTGILNDIAEETEGDMEFEHSWNVGESGLTNAAGKELVSSGVKYVETNAAGKGLISSELEGVEYVETSFVNTGGTNGLAGQNSPLPEEPLTPLGLAPPPSLPVSPPPGPVLSPRLSMLLAEAAGDGSRIPYDPTNRLSIASVSSESPPPLPASMPPGKLISPRHSLMDPDCSGCPNSITGGMGTRLNFAALLSQKVANMPDRGEGAGSHDSVPESVVLNEDKAEWNGELEMECNRATEEPLLITTIDEVDDPDDLCDENLPPPGDPADDETPKHVAGESKLKITPSFLQSLEPPREFSDSGFPDTDHENMPSTSEQGAFLSPTAMRKYNNCCYTLYALHFSLQVMYNNKGRMYVRMQLHVYALPYVAKSRDVTNWILRIFLQKVLQKIEL